MYVTRPLSLFRKSPADLSLPPPEGPNSGILVIQDEEPKCCMNLFKTDMIHDLPLPQNKSLELYYAQGFYPARELHFFRVLFIPVLNQPLSSNQYYAIYPYGKDRGEGYTSSKEDETDMESCCLGSSPTGVKPQLFDPKNLYQQYEIGLHRNIVNISGGFVAKCMAKDGCPPDALRRRGWKLTYSRAHELELGNAPGLDTTLRTQLPSFDFPLKNVVVGKWYCPFMFVREGIPKPLITMYYEMTLEQRWEQIYVEDRGMEHDIGNAVNVDVVVQSEVVVVGGREGEYDERHVGDDGLVWYKSVNNVGEDSRVGVSLAIVERMKWEQERVGWVGGDEGKVRVERVEEYGRMGKWKKFGCFVLVEKFLLKRINGNLLISHEFKHTDQIKCKWE